LAGAAVVRAMRFVLTKVERLRWQPDEDCTAIRQRPTLVI
jgi:hypothetical protein